MRNKGNNVGGPYSTLIRIFGIVAVGLALGGCVGEGDEVLNKPTVVYDAATATETKTTTPTATATETKTATLAMTPTVRPSELATVEQQPAEYMLPQGAPVMETIVERTKDCQYAPWKKMQDGEEFPEKLKLRDTLREQGITVDVIFFTGGVKPEPLCFIGVKGDPEETVKYWYITTDGVLDTFTITHTKP